jgi:hypothetical protein
MVNNYTNINKTNNHLSPVFTEHKKGGSQQLMVEIQVLAWDRHSGGVNLVL